MNARRFSFPKRLEERLERLLSEKGLSLQSAELHAKDVQRLSSQFIENEGVKTPWSEWAAYMVYFFPLNVARVTAAMTESFREFPWNDVTRVIDFGSGPGTVQAAFESSDLDPRPLLSVETDPRAIELHRSLSFDLWPCEWSAKLPAKIDSGTLGVFSYSLLEDLDVERRLSEFDHLLIIAPSTRSQGRHLLEIRRDLLKRGYCSWAPCTHQTECPLLSKSVHDWCHDRIAFEAPEWFRRLESHLPNYNHTLTFSYLFCSRVQTPLEKPIRARVIGDTLYEKGKVRQMICRGPEREFFAWLKRHGEPPQIPRGSLIDLPAEIELRGNELRLKN